MQLGRNGMGFTGIRFHILSNLIAPSQYVGDLKIRWGRPRASSTLALGITNQNRSIDWCKKKRGTTNPRVV